MQQKEKMPLIPINLISFDYKTLSISALKLKIPNRLLSKNSI